MTVDVYIRLCLKPFLKIVLLLHQQMVSDKVYLLEMKLWHK